MATFTRRVIIGVIVAGLTVGVGEAHALEPRSAEQLETVAETTQLPELRDRLACWCEQRKARLARLENRLGDFRLPALDGS
jgi:ferritin-like metal-binding protein YciE